MGSMTGLGFYLIRNYHQLREIKQLQQANNFLAQAKFEAAIEAYDRLLQTNIAPAHQLWINRGYAWFGLNQYDEMLQSCSNATLIEPEAAMGWNCRGEALYYLNQPQAALEALQKAISLNPKDATFWLNQSTVYAALERYQQSIAASSQAAKLLAQSPASASNKLQLAITFNQQGQNWLELNQNQKALEAFEQSLSYLPDYLSAQQGAGIALYRLARYDRAVATFERVLRRDDLTTEQAATSWLYKGISLCEKSTPQKRLSVKKHLSRSNIVAAQQAFEEVLRLTNNPESKAIARAGCGIR